MHVSQEGNGTHGGADRRFARIPKRWTDKLDRGEIGLLEYVLQVYLVAKADYETRECVFPNLAALHAGVDWPHSADQLRKRTLRRLSDLGEISYEVGQGKRGAYIIQVIPDDYFGPPNADWSEVASDSSEVERLGTDGAVRALVGADLRTVRSDAALDVDVALEEEREETQTRTDTGLSIKTEEPVDPPRPPADDVRRVHELLEGAGLRRVAREDAA